MRYTYRLEKLCCAACAAKIERSIQKMPGVQKASVNFLTTRLVVESENTDADAVRAEIEKRVHTYEPKVIVRVV